MSKENSGALFFCNILERKVREKRDVKGNILLCIGIAKGIIKRELIKEKALEKYNHIYIYSAVL